jgi:hypothetical protein
VSVLKSIDWTSFNRAAIVAFFCTLNSGICHFFHLAMVMYTKIEKVAINEFKSELPLFKKTIKTGAVNATT